MPRPLESSLEVELSVNTRVGLIKTLFYLHLTLTLIDHLNAGSQYAACTSNVTHCSVLEYSDASVMRCISFLIL